MARTEPRTGPASWGACRRRRYAWLVTFSLLLLMMLNWADKAVLGIAAVPIMRELRLSPAEFGLLGSAMFGTFVLAQVFGAPVVNRVSAKWALLVLCLLWSAAQLPVLLFATAPALWAGRLLLGLGEGPLAPVMLHGIYKWFPEKKRATPGAVASAGVTLGIVAFSPVLAWLTTAYGWRAAFAILAAAGMAWAAYWVFFGKEGPYDGMESAGQPAERGTVPYSRTILNPTWLLALGTSFFGYWTFTLAMSWGPAYFQTVLGFSGQEAGVLIALPSVWGTAAMIGLNALSQRLHGRGVPTRRSRAWLLGGGAIVSGSAVLAAVWVHSPTAAVALLTIGFGTAPALFPLSLLIVTELTTAARRGANLSLANAAQTSAGLFAPAVSGVLIGSTTSAARGYPSAFILAGALSLGMGVLCALFANQQRDRRRLGLETARVPAEPLSSI
ncbi:MFS transporter [Amycolatopsis silviterrae]|uniref:MFS transporter n=1 Tax=Amycolatopsis silviterrae TaxID=1656914 RepID=A0ABW5HN64_9PSEU